jgi:putative restriction endonuclease
MPPDRLRSIVPMFGGGAHYVDTLDSILEFVKAHFPTTDELLGWHRGTFANVSSRNSEFREIALMCVVYNIKRAVKQ